MFKRQVHLDFHTSEKIENIGQCFDAEQFGRVLQAARVDSITLFAKCHHGWMYYDSEKFEKHPHLDFDLLEAQMSACKKYGINANIYLSAGFDEVNAVRHPEWLVRERDVEPDFAKAEYHKLCYNTEYLDLLLDQIEEAVTRFPSKELFLDISDISPCLCEKCIKDMEARGIDTQNDEQVREFATEVYFNYTESVQRLLDRIAPETKVFHNSGHINRGNRKMLAQNTTVHVESLPTSPLWGYDHFPVSAAYMRALGHEFIGMTGKFHGQWGDFGGYKTPDALRFEAARILACGGGCSIGDQLYPDGKMDEFTYSLIGRAYSEVEAKEPWCDNVEFVADIGVLSCESVVKNIESGRGSTAAMSIDAGVTRMLTEGKLLFEVIDGNVDFSRYKLLVLPDVVVVDDDLCHKLREFTANGGKVIASGASGLLGGSNEFALDLGAEMQGSLPYDVMYFKPLVESVADAKYAMFSDAYEVKGENVLAEFYPPFFNRTAEHFCSHLQTPPSNDCCSPAVTSGKDGIYIAFNIFSEYYSSGRGCNRQLFLALCDILLSDSKRLTTDLPMQGMVSMAYQAEQSRYVIHAVYGNPVLKGEIQVIDDIPVLHDVSFKIKIDEDVTRAYLAPSGDDIEYEREDDRIVLKVPVIDCHQIIVLDVKNTVNVKGDDAPTL